MVAMETTRHFCDGSISENVQGPKLYNCAKFHAFMKKFTYHLKFCTYFMYIIHVVLCQYAIIFLLIYL